MSLERPPANPNADSDGDGLSDYEEMLLWRDPRQAEGLPRLLSNIEKQHLLFVRNARREEIEQRKRLQYRTMIRKAEATMRAAREKDQRYTEQRKRKKGGLALFAKILEKRTDWELAQARSRLDRPSRGQLESKMGTLKGIDSRGRPRFSKTYNEDVAITIQAAPLWPGASSPLPDVDGSGVTVGLWDAGAVFASHDGFGGRVSLGELESDIRLEAELGPNVPVIGAHPTWVAGTLGAGLGVGARYRGIAQNVSILSYHLVNDFSEIGEAAKDGMLFSNHSYGNFAGWSNDNDWWGPVIANTEDPEFGAYTVDTKTMDAIAYLAPNFLSVWGSGNEALHGLRRLPGQTANVDADNDGEPNETSTLTFPNNSGSYLAGATAIPNWPGGDSHDPPGLSLDTIVSTGCAKNHLTVGNISDELAPNGESLSPALPFTQSSQIRLDPTSSRGPTDDGRIKPDLVANGDGVWTVDYSSTSTTSTRKGSGTSFSAPAVTGTLALLEDLRKEVGSSTPLLSSTWKALLCNTAIDGTTLPGYLGTAAQTTVLTGPDYFHGWGACNALGAADLLAANFASDSGTVHLRELILFDGSTIEFPVRHDGTSHELKVMICWTDPPYQTTSVAGVQDDVTDPEGDPADDDLTQDRRRLMNDLDLVVVSPDGQTTHYPWVLNPADDPANPLKKAFQGDANNTNTRDNIEQVVISAPLAGEYRVRITHKTSLKGLTMVTPTDPDTVLPEDADFQLLTGETQNVSICISGNQEISALLPRLTAPVVIAGDHYFQLESDLGLHYRIEWSHDLVTWTEIPGLLIEAQSFPQPIGPLTPPIGTAPVFYRARLITLSNP